TVQTEIQHLRRIRDVFDHVVEEPQSQWRDIARSLAGEDDALFADVMELLAVYARNPISWEDPRLLANNPLDVDLEARVRQLVGRYRLVRLLGHGGMGTVYEAVRADDVYDQRVAVKLMAPQFGAPSMASRFRRERQILASLEHRNIARILDGGTTDKGEPYFVMEYVEGKPITEYCNENRLSIHDRLRLFLQVCAAVQHAHTKLILHRDLKPANMLVASDGSVKLLDFGVAKLLGQTDGAGNGAAGTVTLLGTRALTPEYASPEQLRDDPVSTGSDVYSLGVVLYELLAGRRPYEIPTRSARAALQAIERESPRLSTIATADTAQSSREQDVTRLRRKLAGELDNIVGTALRSDPARRYLSVEQFGADIRRYLEGQPVLAQPDSTGYRLRKYLHRHVAWILAASVAAFALVGGSAAALVQARRAEHERANATRINAFLLDMLSAPDATRGVTDSQPHARTSIADMLDAAAAHARSVLAADPEAESAVRKTLGRTYTSIGRYDDGVAQLTRAIAIDRRIGVPLLPNIASDLIELGNAQIERGDNRAADTLFRAELAICQSNDQRADTAHFCVVGLNDLAGAAWFENHLAESEQLYREALPRYREAFGPKNYRTAVVLGNLGGVLDASGDFTGAEGMYRQSLAVYAEGGGRYLPQRAFTLGNLADNLAQRGRLADADTLLREAIDVISRSESPLHPDAGLAWVQLGAVHRRAGKLSLAQTETKRGSDILVRAGAIARRLFVRVRTSEALLLLAEGKAPEANAILQVAMDSASAEFATDDPRFAHVQAALGATLLALHQPERATAALSKSYATYLSKFGAKHPVTLAVERELQLANSATRQ
ncbi:MAG: serine/threonine-protein kinase, partial [Gemmatimonadaceae bacterium]